MKDLSNLPYRKGVGIMLINRETKVFIGKRIDSTKAWQMPQGGVDQKEDVAESPDISAVTITTEEINADPVKALRSIQDNVNVFIQTEGFHTSKEEWFLMNLSNKTSNVFYTLESFVSHLVKKA